MKHLGVTLFYILLTDYQATLLMELIQSLYFRRQQAKMAGKNMKNEEQEENNEIILRKLEE